MNIAVNNIQYLSGVIARLGIIVEQLGTSFPQPALVPHGPAVAFRHTEAQRTLDLACYLKCVRMISLSNAAMALLMNGFAYESYIMCRTLDEADEEVTFLLVASPNAETEQRKQRLLNEFYQEVYSDPTDGLTTTSRDRLPRRHIHSALAAMRAHFGDSDRMRRTVQSIFHLFSAFAHGSYTTIMELFGGWQPKYHTRGMSGTPKVLEAIDNFPRHFYRVILSVELLCRHTERQDLQNECRQLADEFSQQTNCAGNPEEAAS